MVRVLIAAILGAVIYFAWGAAAWGALGLYSFAFPPLQHEQMLKGQINETLAESGAYVFPALPDASDPDSVTAWQAAHRTGPLGMIILNKKGTEPMSPLTFARGFGVELLAALILCMLLWWAKIDSYGGRLSFIFFAALFAVVTTHAVQWNFFYLPADYTFALMIDPLVGWLLAGLAMAAIVRPRPKEQPAA